MEPELSRYAPLAIPSELDQVLPRKVDLDLSEGDGRFVVLTILFCLVGGLASLGWMGYKDAGRVQQRAVLRGSAQTMTGTVTGISTNRGLPASVKYTFAVDGVTYFGEASERPYQHGKKPIRKADDILVRFLPSNPTINHPDAWEWSAAPEFYLVCYFLFVTALGCGALIALLRDRRLARSGSVAAGTVTSCTPR